MNADDIFNEVMSNKQSGQRGKKRCPDCDSLVGVRTYSCECGHQFVNKKTKAEKRQEEDAPTEEEKLYAICVGAPGGRLVYTGSGSPSVKLTSLDKQVVFDYCNFVVHEGITQGVIYTVEAIKHYIMHQLGYNSDEYKQACKYVDQWYDEKMGVDTPSGAEYNDTEDA